MISAVIEVLTNINVSLQLLGGVLIGFKMIATYQLIAFLITLKARLFILVLEGMFGVILLSINLILALIAYNLLMRGKAVRRCAALILLGISQVLVGIVVISNIAAAVYNGKMARFDAPKENSYEVDYHVFYIVTSFYYFFTVFLSQSVLMFTTAVVLIIQYKNRRGSMLNSQKDETITLT